MAKLLLKRIEAHIDPKNAKYLLLLVVVVLGAYRRFSLPLTPFGDNDTPGYLAPVLSFFQYGHLSHANARGFLYPLYVLCLVFVGHSFSIVTVAQHIMGLCTGLIIFRILDESNFKGLTNKLYRWLLLLIQLNITAYFLLAGEVILYEHTLRPEALAMFFMVLLVGVLLKIQLQPKAARLTIWLPLVVFLDLFLFVLFPRWGFALPVVFVVSAFYFVRLKLSAIKKLVLAAVPVVLFAVVVWLPERYLVNTYDSTADSFLARQFFYVHADMVKTLLKKDIAQCKDGEEDKKKTLMAIDSTLDIASATNDNFQLLGFDPDKLMYGEANNTIEALLRNQQNKVNAAEADEWDFAQFAKQYDVRVIGQEPKAYGHKVCHQIRMYYAPPFFSRGWTYLIEQKRFWSGSYADSYNALSPSGSINDKIYGDYLTQLAQLKDYNWASRFRFLNGYYLFLRISFFPTLLLFLLATVAKPFLMKRKPLDEQAFLTRVFSFAWALVLIHLALVVTVASIHTFDNDRYYKSIFPITLLMQASCMISLLSLGIACLWPFRHEGETVSC